MEEEENKLEQAGRRASPLVEWGFLPPSKHQHLWSRSSKLMRGIAPLQSTYGVDSMQATALPSNINQSGGIIPNATLCAIYQILC
jgi:hypothetical protein